MAGSARLRASIDLVIVDEFPICLLVTRRFGPFGQLTLNEHFYTRIGLESLNVLQGSGVQVARAAGLSGMAHRAGFERSFVLPVFQYELIRLMRWGFGELGHTSDAQVWHICENSVAV